MPEGSLAARLEIQIEPGPNDQLSFEAEPAQLASEATSPYLV